MQIQAECRPCLERLVDMTVALATPREDLREQARAAARAIIEAEFGPAAISAIIANHFHRAIKGATGNPDPFRPRKEAETRLLQRLYAEVAPGWDRDLRGLFELAAAGNALDFFRGEAEVAQNIRRRVRLQGEVESLVRRLQGGGGLLLYLADNAGEQFFDEPLVTGLRQQGWQAVYVVKGGPIQNDLTREDLAASGLAAALEPVADTGALTVGLVLEETSPAFRELFKAADVIIAKGMGHYETLAGLPDPRLYFFLQAKCRPVAAALGAEPGDFLLRAAVKG